MTEEPNSPRCSPDPLHKPPLLLHICCGPCSTHVIDLLKESHFPIGFFFNPNLYPRDEYFRRLEATARVCRAQGTALWIPPFEPDLWLARVEGLEKEPEGGRRCEICMQLRLEVTAWVARSADVGIFATTLTISPKKNSLKINQLGSALAEEAGVAFLEADFKKKDGFLKSVRKSKELDLYRQNYCGCCHNMKEG
jgi:predicted adenine nucleotide alpha hydrolase (AANH) superfamily ATPase